MLLARRKPRPRATHVQSYPNVKPIPVYATVLVQLPVAFNLLSTYSVGRLAGYQLIVSTISFLFYAFDKYRASSQGWRVQESILLGIDAAGGWPGGWIAQRWLRHKILKRWYQVWFCLIVLSWMGFWLHLTGALAGLEGMFDRNS